MRGSRARLAGQVAYPRTRSPYYRELYRHLPDHVDDPALLPPSTKARLMERFDDWVTDPAVTLAKVAATGARTAVIVAVGGHFGSSVLVPEDGRARRNYRVFPATTPLPELVERLNRFRPAVVTGYASVIALLAGEQQAGCLRIDPVLVLPGSEGLPLSAYDSIAGTFGATVRNGYAATELTQPIGGCSRHWLHVNTDWALVEPVDEDYRPTPPGRPSHTVLITNLANRIQPFIRYDLGDSVVRRPDPCPCGNPRPAIRVQGRAADALNLADASGAVVRLSPLALGATVDRTPGVELYQPDRADRAHDPACTPAGRGAAGSRLARRARRDHRTAPGASARPRHGRARHRTAGAVGGRQVPPDHPAAGLTLSAMVRAHSSASVRVVSTSRS